MEDEFVIGFCSDDPEGLTPIEIVVDVTELTRKEIRSCYETMRIPMPDGPIFEYDHSAS